MTQYRFYHCYQKSFSIVCIPVDDEHTLPSEPNTRLLFVSNYIPRALDTVILKYNYYQDLKIVRKTTV
jgi:hypothetical protein